MKNFFFVRLVFFNQHDFVHLVHDLKNQIKKAKNFGSNRTNFTVKTKHMKNIYFFLF